MTSLRNIVISGASSGLGAALALEYAGPGVTLGLMGRNETRLHAIAVQCRDKGAEVVTALLDIKDLSAIDQWVNEFDTKYPIDLCIANAGISAGTGGSGETVEQAVRIFDINVSGVIHLITPASVRMVARRKGQIAIVSSIAGFRGSPTAPAYSASKAAIRTYGQALHGALEPLGVDVSVICPGFIRTPMTDVNPFPMPFIISAEKAASIIRKGLKKRRRLIAFPWPMFFLARLQNLLPDAWINRLYRAVPAKPVE